MKCKWEKTQLPKIYWKSKWRLQRAEIEYHQVKLKNGQEEKTEKEMTLAKSSSWDYS